MKAVRAFEGAATVVEVDEPPGTGELLEIEAASICASDLLYLELGSRSILGHELAGRRADGTAVVVEARLIPSLGYCAHEGGREMADAAAMLADDPEIARTLITHRFGIDDLTEAFRVAADKTSGAIRVVIEP